MATAIGANAYLAIGEESTYGTGATELFKLQSVVEGIGMNAAFDRLISRAIDATLAPKIVRGGNKNVRLTVPFELSIVGLARFTRFILGANITTGTGPYIHTQKRGALPTGLSLEIGLTDISKFLRCVGGKIESATFNFTNGSEYVNGTAEIIFANATVETASLDSSITDLSHTPLYHGDLTLKKEGGSAFEFISATITLANNLDTRIRPLGSQIITELPRGKGLTEGNIVYPFRDTTITAKAIAQTQTSLQWTFTIGTDSLDVNLPQVQYVDNHLPGVDTQQALLVTQNWVAEYNTSAASDIVMTYTNLESTVA